MFKKIVKSLLDMPTDSTDVQHEVRQACAALLVEVARADFEAKPEEFLSLCRFVQSKYELSEAALSQLIADAEERVGGAVGLHEFTSTINSSFSASERCALIAEMWKVAYADGMLHPYEEHLIRKVSDLIYVPHSDFIRLKHQARMTLQ